MEPELDLKWKVLGGLLMLPFSILVTYGGYNLSRRSLLLLFGHNPFTLSPFLNQ